MNEKFALSGYEIRREWLQRKSTMGYSENKTGNIRGITADWCNGSTKHFDCFGRGSNPLSAAGYHFFDYLLPPSGKLIKDASQVSRGFVKEKDVKTRLLQCIGSIATAKAQPLRAIKRKWRQGWKNAIVRRVR